MTTAFSPAVGTALLPSSDSGSSAGFWHRFLAHLIDWVIATVVAGFVVLAASSFTRAPLESRIVETHLGGLLTVTVDVQEKSVAKAQDGRSETRTKETVTARIAGLPFYMNRHHVTSWESKSGMSSMTLGYPSPMWLGLVTGLMLIAGAFFEASKLQATPGKLALGLKVIDDAGRPLSLSCSVMRQAAKLISAALLLVGFLMIGMTKRRQGLHDIIASTLVARNNA